MTDAAPPPDPTDDADELAWRWGIGHRERVPLEDMPPAVLALVDRRWGGRFCVLCQEQGLVTPEDEPLVLDHLRPLAHGGDNRAMNLRWLCRGHNARRGARPLWAGLPAWHERRGRP